MKKIVIFFIMILIIIAIISVKYSSYVIDKKNIISENEEYEQYMDKEIYGLDVASIINKSTDRNIRNNISKDENGMFIQNDKNSIEIEIFMKDNEKTYKSESIYNNGTEQFVQYYGNIKFKCTKIEYHKSTGRISYMLFEQI